MLWVFLTGLSSVRRFFRTKTFKIFSPSGNFTCLKFFLFCFPVPGSQTEPPSCTSGQAQPSSGCQTRALPSSSAPSEATSPQTLVSFSFKKHQVWPKQKTFSRTYRKRAWVTETKDLWKTLLSVLKVFKDVMHDHGERLWRHEETNGFSLLWKSDSSRINSGKLSQMFVCFS